MKFAIIFSSFWAAAFALSLESPRDKEWETYKEEYGKSYKPSEDAIRYNIFKAAKAQIDQHYEEYLNGEHSYYNGLNKFSDYLPYETEMLKGYKKAEVRSKSVSTFIPPVENIEIPSSIDWRTKGAVTPVKDQGQCGSCWAFSATGALEGHHFIKTGKLVSLSKQQLVDCDFVGDNWGCRGGDPELSFQYIMENHGIDTEESYPYIGQRSSPMPVCYYNNKTIGATDKGSVEIKKDDEAELQTAVGTVGPVSISINAYRLEAYEGGIFENSKCNSNLIDHAILVVGYGTSQEGVPYWIIKNSWGPDWGEKGYFRMKRGVNMCGVAARAVYPLV